MYDKFFKEKINVLVKYFNLTIVKIAYDFRIEGKTKLSISYRIQNDPKNLYVFDFVFNKEKEKSYLKFENHFLGDILTNNLPKLK